VPSWRELLAVYRRWEARGEIRGGRFVDALGGEQYALSEAVQSLRRVRRSAERAQWVKLSAADPLNLAGLVGAGKKVAAIASHQIVYKDGVPVAARSGAGIEWLVDSGAGDREAVHALFNPVGRAQPRVAASSVRTPRQGELLAMPRDSD
jgi:ATP-dependent Lhr-like helicase